MTRNRPALDYARRHGWEVAQTRGNHLRLTRADISGCVHTSSTPSDWRGDRNTIARMRRIERMAGGGVQR